MTSGCRCYGKHQIWMEFRQLGRERREHAAVTQSHIECQIPSLHVPCSAKRLAKSVEVPRKTLLSVPG